MDQRNAIMFLALLAVFAGACEKKKQEPVKDSVVEVEAEDAAINEAMAEARAHLDVFEAALEKGEAGKSFDIKAAFPTPDGGEEHMWLVGVEAVEGGFAGKLDNQPQGARDLVPGERYRVERKQVSDWQITDEKRRIWGNYTLRAMLPRLDPNDRQAVESRLQPLPRSK